ncbi:hypothetical protein MAJ_08161, partial [Metarhizium majus ARSEF 297]
MSQLRLLLLEDKRRESVQSFRVPRLQDEADDETSANVVVGPIVKFSRKQTTADVAPEKVSHSASLAQFDQPHFKNLPGTAETGHGFPASLHGMPALQELS